MPLPNSWPNYIGSPTERGQQSRDISTWWPDTRIVCGDCHATTHQYSVLFAWDEDNDPTQDTTNNPFGPPRHDFRFMFDFVQVTREPAIAPIPELLPTGNEFDVPLRYLTCHWISKVYASELNEPGLGTLSDLRWCLFYGPIDHATTADPLSVPSSDDAVTQFSDEFLWYLVLLQKQASGNPAHFFSRPVLIYNLLEGMPFLCQRANHFENTHCLLELPLPHYAIISPVCRLSVPKTWPLPQGQ